MNPFIVGRCHHSRKLNLGHWSALIDETAAESKQRSLERYCSARYLWRNFRDFWHGNSGNNWDGRLRLVTNLMYAPAALIAERTA